MNKQYARGRRRIKETLWNDYDCLIINSSYRGSTQFEGHPNFNKADLMIAWTWDGERYSYGIYSTKKHINVGDLCKTYLNGGGHAGAGGGCSTEFPFYKFS